MKEQVTLACTECRRRNYHTTKNPKNVRGKLEFKKYCKWCKRHTTHREV
ncbi:MAG: 50S ribosomal protein L33 [Candidatus Bipolaricaulia bacterium]